MAGGSALRVTVLFSFVAQCRAAVRVARPVALGYRKTNKGGRRGLMDLWLRFKKKQRTHYSLFKNKRFQQNTFYQFHPGKRFEVSAVLTKLSSILMKASNSCSPTCHLGCVEDPSLGGSGTRERALYFFGSNNTRLSGPPALASVLT